MTIAALLFALIATTAAEATAQGQPVLLDFSASWCGPCKQMRPAVEQLIEKGFPVKAIDIDESPQMAERYQVTSVPTFIVVDGSGKAVARTQGYQPAAQLAQFYNDAKARIVPPSRPKAHVSAREDGEDDDEPEATAPVNPKPWETGVRIKVQGNGMLGFGSGTIIHSTPRETIILSCAHIFKMDGRRQFRPSEFPNPVFVDLFDGQLRGTRTAQVHYTNETYKAEVLDYDFARDVSLIRIRPGRRLKASRVVPAHWAPKARMQLITVGCSEGNDATAWNTLIVNPSMKGLSGNAAYEAIECTNAPKQGRSGGGLYTSDGYVAGVCDFAEPRGNVGLYATPRSIHSILERNNLMALYAPVDRQRDRALLADRGAKPAPKTKSGRTRPSSGDYARAQSPDREDADLITMPDPELLGIKTPKLAANTARSTAHQGPWHPAPKPITRVSAESPDEEAEATDLKLDPKTNSDRFSSMRTDADDPARNADNAPAPQTKPSSKSKWRAVGTAQAAAPGR